MSVFLESLVSHSVDTSENGSHVTIYLYIHTIMNNYSRLFLIYFCVHIKLLKVVLDICAKILHGDVKFSKSRNHSEAPRAKRQRRSDKTINIRV